MSSTAFSLTIHMVASLDGIIAKKDNSISWFETADFYEKGIEISDADTTSFLKTIDCYVMGARTYEHAVELSQNYGWAYGDTPVMVVSNKALPINRPHIETYAGDLHRLVTEILQPKYRNVWVVGGPSLVRDFIQLDLVQEIRLSVLPIILGEGLLFFEQTGKEKNLHLKDVRAYKSGMVELCYEVKRQ